MSRVLDSDIQTNIDEQVNRALARINFWEFCLYMDEPFFTKRPFLKQIAEAFQEIADGLIMKASISMSPRAGKSYKTSLFCAWWLGRNPELCVMRNTVTSHLYRKFSYDVRNLIKSPKYQNVFPKIKLAEDKQNIDGWSLTSSRQGAYFGGGVGTNIIGFGANLAVTDDLYSGFEQALSEVYSEKVLQWKQGSHDSRKEKNCPEIYIGTRWSKNDVIGIAIDSDDIDIVINIPALDEHGNSFCEDVKTTEEYLKIKQEVDDTIWAAEYMQEPIEAKGLLFPKSELKMFDRANVDLSKAEYQFIYVDPADEGGDYNSAPGCVLIGDRIYLPKELMSFNKDGTDVNIPSLVETICNNMVEAVEVEGNSAWILFGKDLRNKVQERYQHCEVRIIKNTTNKNTRIIAQAAFIKNHFYFDADYESHPQYRQFIKNLTGYLREGTNKHEDAPDSLAGCAQHFKSKFSHLW
jgi:predicted phage terminase large subunit-like protein